MNNKTRLPLIKKSTAGSAAEQKEAKDSGLDSSPGQHVGTSDAFLQTENTASPDADNLSDEKLDEMLNTD